MSGPIEPVDLDSLLFVNVDGERQLGRPNGRERALAEALLRDRALLSRSMGMQETLATVLAAVREGSTIEGRRSTVEAYVNVSRYVIESPQRADAEASATRALWRRWIDELAEHSLRPVGWPTVTRRHLAWTVEAAMFRTRRNGTDPGMVEVEPELHGDWHLVQLGLECEAVPITP